MMLRQAKRSDGARAAALALIIGGLVAAPAALAAAPCSVAGLTALGVANMTFTSATDVPAAPPLPEFCNIKGTVTTTGEGAPNGSAIFLAQLPANWNHKLLGLGNGGFAGAASLAGSGPALVKGYALVDSDTGHEAGGTDASWALKADGTPDQAKLTDYYFRAVHEVTVAAKQLTERFFAQGALRHSYFTSCSNGGRQALMEASRFPDDYDGIIAGDPFMSIRSIAGGTILNKQQSTAQTFIPFTQLAMIDQATLAACDAADGVKDGLIQNPGACNFQPQSLQCRPGQNSNCLSAGQVQTLTTYISAARDDDHNIVYPGFSISDLGGTDGAALWTTGFFLPGQALPAPNTQATFDLTAKEPWGNLGFSPAPLGWQFVDHAIQFIVERDPNFDMRTFDGTAPTPLSDAALNLFDRRTEAGDADDPARLERFIRRDHKLLIYHGFSDPALTAFRSIQYYEDLASRTLGGIPEVQENVRLFLAPGMHHCAGGPGPNVFDTLTALEGWVEQGVGADAIIATKFANDNPAGQVLRTMPLCKFPEQAHFLGNPNSATAAEIDNAANWTCPPGDRSMLTVGADGRMAGLGGRQAAEFEFDFFDRDRDRDDR
jgi:feruloyl esterase